MRKSLQKGWHQMKYVICDMDGTLLNEEKEYSKEIPAIISKLKEQGVCFGIASGRQYYNIKAQFEDFAKDMVFICENGSMLFLGEEPVYADEIAYQDLLMPVERMRQAKDAWPVLCGVKSAYIEHRDEEFVRNAKMYYERLEIVDDLLEAAKHDTICKISVFDRINNEQNAYPFLKEYMGNLHLVVSGKHWMDGANPGVNKGKAIQILKQQGNLSSDDFVCFGDYLNDYEMMQEATYSYAMANAHPDILKVANFTTKSNEEDGVVYALKQLFDL